MATTPENPGTGAAQNNIPQTDSPVLQPPSSSQLREMLEELVVADLRGPAGGPEEEVAEDRVKERYLVGMLAPRRTFMPMESREEVAVAAPDSEDEGSTDQGNTQSDTLFPSSLGMTFAMVGDAPGLRFTARWGRYHRQQSDTATNPKSGKPLPVWKRTPIEATSAVIPLKEGTITPWIVTPEQPEVTVQGRMRQNDGDWIVTLFLINGQEEPKQRKDEAWLFQPELCVESADGQPYFCKRLSQAWNPEKLDPLTRSEQDAMAMLYRRQVEFAVGHGVAVDAEADPHNPERALRIKTAVIPAYEVPQQTPPRPGDKEYIPNLVLDMKELAETPGSDISGKLRPLIDAYAQWIQDEDAKLADPGEGLAQYQEAAKDAIVRCRHTLERIREGIALLTTDETAAEAFRFANRAMYLQRTHSLFSREVRKGKRKAGEDLADIDIPRNRSWYPFQLAFILLNLPSVTDLHHPDRSDETKAITDLLWFPTGGGKTEAYLGLAAYTMALRRLQGEIEGRSGECGVAVLMRYTLRLLTLQQFQRAATLICACETIRRGDPAKWGQEPFRIGLWVGMRATPNTTAQAFDAITQSHGAWNGEGAQGTPAQLTTCPWCGSKIDPGKNIRVYEGMSSWNRTVLYCGDPLGSCPFSERQSPIEGIPALVVDEEIYRHPPSLLIATVDKFAQMPWKGEVQMLFGQVDALCPRHGFRSPEIKDSDSHPKRGNLPAVKSISHAPLRPPDLIIQDELHLISGPLGSLVGLYETAVDELASWQVDGKRVRPKVIASTATIRRAKDQVQKLFLRDVDIFPPHGTEISNNFFSLQRQPSEQDPGRRYLGICATGKRYPAALIRVYVAFLAAAQKLYEQYDTIADPWMTLVGYFNSIREMGGTRRLVEDDISSRLRDADQRGLAKRRRPFLEELTSRKGSGEIPSILDRLDIGFNQQDDKRRQALRKAGKRADTPNPLDVVLATNMISVGVDVNRLGLMVVAGQPKATAEYIQATSRVGRRYPGLVCTVYNWARPRDLSHYETFEHYHATFYQHVEALSVTPFAPRALDRGLSGVMVSLIRLASDVLNANQQAGSLERDEPLLQQAIEAIIQRAVSIMGKKAGDEVRQMLMERRDDWLKQIQQAVAHHLGYHSENNGETVGLLKPAGAGRWERFTCLNSLRDVEPNVNLILGDDYGLEPIHTSEYTKVVPPVRGESSGSAK